MFDLCVKMEHMTYLVVNPYVNYFVTCDFIGM